MFCFWKSNIIKFILDIQLYFISQLFPWNICIDSPVETCLCIINKKMCNVYCLAKQLLLFSLFLFLIVLNKFLPYSLPQVCFTFFLNLILKFNCFKINIYFLYNIIFKQLIQAIINSNLSPKHIDGDIACKQLFCVVWILIRFSN